VAATDTEDKIPTGRTPTLYRGMIFLKSLGPIGRKAPKMAPDNFRELQGCPDLRWSYRKRHSVPHYTAVVPLSLDYNFSRLQY